MDNASLYYLLRGRMLVHLGSLSNPALDHHNPGECAGELSFLDGQRPSAYVVAAEPSEVIRIDADVLTELIEASHGVSINLIHILTSRMRFGLGKIRDTYDNYVEQQIKANTDVLTGLHNRRWFDDMYVQVFAECHQSNRSACLLMVDIDNFKQYNDTNGHLAGDRALATVAQVLKHGLNYTDLFARYGGEEFAIFLPDKGAVECMSIGRRLCKTIAETKILGAAEQALPFVTISIGLAQLDQDRQKSDELINAADRALYRAKDKGRNQISDLNL
jgi:diguanylate cyclase (GGDEF)-like protein